MNTTDASPTTMTTAITMSSMLVIARSIHWALFGSVMLLLLAWVASWVVGVLFRYRPTVRALLLGILAAYVVPPVQAWLAAQGVQGVANHHLPEDRYHLV